MAKKPETNFRTNTVIPFLKKLRGTKYFGIQQLAKCGDPDFLLCCESKFVGLELKAVGEKPDPLQRRILQEIESAGGYTFVADPTNWAEVKEALIKLDRGEDL